MWPHKGPQKVSGAPPHVSCPFICQQSIGFILISIFHLGGRDKPFSACHKHQQHFWWLQPGWMRLPLRIHLWHLDRCACPLLDDVLVISSFSWSFSLSPRWWPFLHNVDLPPWRTALLNVNVQSKWHFLNEKKQSISCYVKSFHCCLRWWQPDIFLCSSCFLLLSPPPPDIYHKGLIKTDWLLGDHTCLWQVGIWLTWIVCACVCVCGKKGLLAHHVLCCSEQSH